MISMSVFFPFMFLSCFRNNFFCYWENDFLRKYKAEEKGNKGILSRCSLVRDEVLDIWGK